MAQVVLNPIGRINSPYTNVEDMPIQPGGAKETQGTVVVDDAYADGLADLDGFSHIILIYQFHRSQGFELRVKPFLDNQLRGLFSTRAPRRPNPIGLSVVTLTKREGSRLHVLGIDVLDGTPLIDIKPFVPAFDAPEVTAVGWLEGKQGLEEKVRSDHRFSPIDK